MQSPDNNTNNSQRNYFRNGPSHRAGADVSFADIVKIFGFNSIHIGRWVNAAEQQRAANLFFDALCDLQLLLQVPPEVISLRGTLALHYGIGGQKGACAHYQPSGRILALAKNAGGGSLAHEWFHAFDHYIADKMFASQSKTIQFASRRYLTASDIQPHLLNEQLALGFKTLFLSSDGLSPSPFFLRCRDVDKAKQLLYFSLPEEMAARAFEHMLQRQRLKNSFLVSGTLKSTAAKLGIYPDSTLSNALSDIWLGYFKALGKRLNTKA
ncbi:MAG TPA: CLCA_X family protein [Rheinheimera sp.]|nr:CLCA_X family protein [Rheinheimera sp.]